jgi:uncharacterized OB-fold protein
MENQFSVTAFNNYLNEHRLMGSRDAKTGEMYLPPRPINPANFSTNMEWVEFSGKGTLEAFTNILSGSTAMIAAGYDRKNPYTVGIVKTAEGPMISAQILGVNSCDPSSIMIGTKLKVVFIDRGEGETKKTFLGFEPA